MLRPMSGQHAPTDCCAELCPGVGSMATLPFEMGRLEDGRWKMAVVMVVEWWVGGWDCRLEQKGATELCDERS